MKSIIITLLIVTTCFFNFQAQKVSIDKSILAGGQIAPSNGVTITDNILWFNYLNGALRAGRLSSDA